MVVTVGETVELEAVVAVGKVLVVGDLVEQAAVEAVLMVGDFVEQVAVVEAV